MRWCRAAQAVCRWRGCQLVVRWRVYPMALALYQSGSRRCVHVDAFPHYPSTSWTRIWPYIYCGGLIRGDGVLGV
jgi:hypothetical protein